MVLLCNTYQYPSQTTYNEYKDIHNNAVSPLVFVICKRFNRGLPFNLQVTDERWKIIVPKIVILMMEVVLNRFPQQEA